MSEYLVYLSGPITGLTFDNASDWRTDTMFNLANRSNYRIKTLSPMRGKRYLRSEKPIGAQNGHLGLLSTDQAIYTRDRNDVLRSDIMLVNLMGATKVSIGTVIEMVWAAENNVPQVIALEEGNVHIHPILSQVGRLFVPTLAAAEDFVYQLLKDDSWDLDAAKL